MKNRKEKKEKRVGEKKKKVLCWTEPSALVYMAF